MPSSTSRKSSAFSDPESRKRRFISLFKIIAPVVFVAAASAVYLDANILLGKPDLGEMGKRAVELLDLSLGLLAAYLGGIGYYDLLSSARKSEEILESLSTRGTLLPGALKEITAMLERPGVQEVRIMCDYADYGYYADHGWNLAYKSKLVTLGNSVHNAIPKICILSHSEEQARKDLLDRFKDFDVDPEKREAWLEKARITKGAIQLEEFVERLVKKERNWMSELLELKIAWSITEDRLPLRLWIVKYQDNTCSAVIAIPLRNTSEKDTERGVTRLRGGEVSFYTNDAHVIDGFVRMFDEYFEKAKPREQKDRTGPLGGIAR